MKWRNQLLAFFCLFVFAGVGVLYFQHWVIQKPFGIILFIGEGLGPERLAATRVYMGGADARLGLDSMTYLALMTNASKDFAVADSAAAATAIATGAKVKNGAIAMEANGKPLVSIVDLARQRGREADVFGGGLGRRGLDGRKETPALAAKVLALRVTHGGCHGDV